MAIPQLKVRTEFSYRAAYGPVVRVAQRCAEVGAEVAGIVDPNTWGHVRWEKACRAAGIDPAFGVEFAVPDPATGFRPTAWALASDSRSFYRFSTAVAAAAGDPELIRSALAARGPGVVVFSGAALVSPELFDYVDLSPASPSLLARSLTLSRSTGRPLVVASDNAYPFPEDVDRFLAISDRRKITPQWLLSEAEMRGAMKRVPDEEWAAAVRGTYEAAERVRSVPLATAPLIRFDGDLRALAEEGKRGRLKRGHIAEWTEEYELRLQHELRIIEEKHYESYFLVVSDLVRWAKKHMLVGPGRGSSAGSLLCYLIEITEVDPLVHRLLFERFLDVTRTDLPDIDIDFSDSKRDLVFQYLADKYGPANVARLGNINTLKPRSIITEVSKRMGIPMHDTWAIRDATIEYSSGDSRYGNGLEDTLTGTDPGRAFLKKYPEAAIMATVEGHAWHAGVHAAGVIVSNEPVSDFCTVGKDGVAQLDKPDAERLNLLKIDALGLRTLGIIEETGAASAEELYGLKLDDPEVFSIFNARKFCGIFQFEGATQRQVAVQIPITTFSHIDHITALARPGPLGGGASERYIRRHRGEVTEEESMAEKFPMLRGLLQDTYGVVLYQEQVMQISRDIGKFDWADIAVIRKAMSGSKGKEFFDRYGEQFLRGAATEGISAADAQSIWSTICTFGAWGMNRSHTVSYSIISYWCAWMKRYHPLPYAAACLRHTRHDDEALSMLRELAEEGVRYIPFDVERSGVDWEVVNGELIGGFKNLVGYGPAKAVAAVEARRLGTLDREKIAKCEIMYKELYPIQVAYGHFYASPEEHGIRPGTRVLRISEFPEEGEVVFIARVLSKQKRDENETLRIKKREGKVFRSPTLFCDMTVIDDSGISLRARVGRFEYEPLGRAIVDNIEPGKDVLLLRGRKIRGLTMVSVTKARCLTRPEALDI